MNLTRLIPHLTQYAVSDSILILLAELLREDLNNNGLKVCYTYIIRDMYNDAGFYLKFDKESKNNALNINRLKKMIPTLLQNSLQHFTFWY